MPSEEMVVALLVGDAATEAAAAQITARFSVCPYAATYESGGRLIIGVYALPAAKKWWLRVPARQPDILGLERAAVFFTDNVQASSPWSRGEVTPDMEAAPCGSSCEECPFYRRRCEGCPATVYYRAD